MVSEESEHTIKDQITVIKFLVPSRMKEGPWAAHFTGGGGGVTCICDSLFSSPPSYGTLPHPHQHAHTCNIPTVSLYS